MQKHSEISETGLPYQKENFQVSVVVNVGVHYLAGDPLGKAGSGYIKKRQWTVI
jgi:hypothetical protein